MDYSSDSAAVRSLKYRRGDAKDIAETKAGYVIFSGNPIDFADWMYRVEVKVKTSAQGKYPESIGNILEALRGDALQVARDVGIDALIEKGGWEQLV